MDQFKTEGFLQRHRPEKSWGYEEWIVNNDLYCGKRLVFEVINGCTSFHFHAKKHETMYVESGVFEIVISNTRNGTTESYSLHQGSSIVIPQNTPHRIIARKLPAVLIEFSTHHEDSDSYRIEK